MDIHIMIMASEYHQYINDSHVFSLFFALQNHPFIILLAKNSPTSIRVLNNFTFLSYSDDTPLIRDEFLNEAPIGPHDLGAEPMLGVAIDEPDSWSPSVPKEVVKSLKDKQVKRQEHIYEFIMTEKHHCQTLLVMQKVFVDSLQRHFSHLNLDRMFPRLQELTELHLW